MYSYVYRGAYYILKNREYKEWHNKISKYAYVTSMWVQLHGQVLIRVPTLTHTHTHIDTIQERVCMTNRRRRERYRITMHVGVSIPNRRYYRK